MVAKLLGLFVAMFIVARIGSWIYDVFVFQYPVLGAAIVMFIVVLIMQKKRRPI